jgi:light-regulated signal transduction histidine kinase (bacteriophytochrome)
LQKKELIEKNQSLEKADAQIKQLNADLQKNLLQLEEVNKELESFSYSVSHDLRAPVRALVGFSKMLEESYNDTLDDEGKRMVGVIHRNAIKMGSLIDDLLEFSKMGRQEVRKSAINVADMVKEVISDITDQTEYHANVTINELLPTYADRALLTQVWINLISNAFKYSAKKENPAVEIGSHRDDRYIVYYVKDNGAGFSMEYAEKLFGVFQRLHKASEFEGTGVGLAIVHRIITRHGGRATFFFTLPGDKSE